MQLLQVYDQSFTSKNRKSCLSTRHSGRLIHFRTSDDTRCIGIILSSPRRIPTLVLPRQCTGSRQTLRPNAARRKPCQHKRRTAARSRSVEIVRIVQQDPKRLARAIECCVPSIVGTTIVKGGEMSTVGEECHSRCCSVVWSSHVIPSPEAVLAVADGPLVIVCPGDVVKGCADRIVHSPKGGPESRTDSSCTATRNYRRSMSA